MVSVTADKLRRDFSKSKYRFSIRQASVVVILVCLVISLINLLEFKNSDLKTDENEEEKEELTYMLHGDRLNSGYLEHVINVLDRLGLKRIQNGTDFDLLWSHPYPFGEYAPFSREFMQNLKPNQKVNHFPGSGYFTNKVDLATSDLKHVPRAFHLPGQKTLLLEYAKNNPNHLFVQKSNSHRGIKILKVEEMNLDSTGTFVQEYVQDPLLVDGYKFDIGIYTILTSVDPLRVYIYNGDALLRFCPKKYEPFDPEDVDRYVVGDDYIPIWNMPSLNESYVNLKFGMKDSLNIFLRKEGKNPKKIWNQIEESIRTVFLHKEDKLIRTLTRFKSNPSNFFEMVRFDFVVDSDLNVYLMEANMSPNLSSQHFRQNRQLYENVLYSLFSLVNVGRRIKTGYFGHEWLDEEEMEVPEKNLMVFGDECAKEGCLDCGPAECLLCKHCLTGKGLQILKNSYLEYVNRVDCKRIFPPPLDAKKKITEIQLDEYSPENRFMVLWFLGKCKEDRTWC